MVVVWVAVDWVPEEVCVWFFCVVVEVLFVVSLLALVLFIVETTERSSFLAMRF